MQFCFCRKQKAAGRYCRLSIVVPALILLLVLKSPCGAAPSDAPNARDSALLLGKAVVCPEIRHHRPADSAVVFSVAAGKVFCFTEFTSVPEQTVIYHRWFFRDKPVSRIMLTLKPPRWSTYSSVTLRELDKGPWRVDITDRQNHVYQSIRFSIVD